MELIFLKIMIYNVAVLYTLFGVSVTPTGVHSTSKVYWHTQLSHLGVPHIPNSVTVHDTFQPVGAKI